jgi:hydrogenase expression/formation protein HypD
MKYVDEFREPRAAAALRGEIAALGDGLGGRTVRIMEVCGTHTMAIARYGIRGLLPPNVELISGPGCPVCVTPPGYIDTAVALADAGVTVMTFGDMVNVPGSSDSLAGCRAGGGDVRTCYSPTAAATAAAAEPGREVVFLGIGFETTIPTVVSLVNAARRNGLTNLSLLTAFKLIPPALAALRSDPELRIDAFLCPAHVSAVIGADVYTPFAGPDGVPCVIAGFEPLDILLGIRGVLTQLTRGEARVDNQYSRVVRPEGNRKAGALMAAMLTPDDGEWRGLGCIPESALRLRPELAEFDAEIRHGIQVGAGNPAPGCRCGEVIKGKQQPVDCPLFGGGCTPDTPIGPCMVSAEGTCAASYRYGERHHDRD